MTAKNDRGKEKINEQKSEREGVRERRGVPAIFCSKNGGGGDELVTMRVLCCVVLVNSKRSAFDHYHYSSYPCIAIEFVSLYLQQQNKSNQTRTLSKIKLKDKQTNIFQL